MRLTAMAAAVALATTLTGGAQAAVTIRDVAVRNAGFEAEQRGDGNYCRGCVPDWQAVGYGAPDGYGTSGSGVLDPAEGSGTSAPGGNQFAIIDTFTVGATPFQGGLTQSLDEDVVLGTTYSLSLDVVRRLGIPMANWLAELYVGEAMRVVASGTLTSASVADGGYSPLTLGFTGSEDDAGKRLGIRFRSFYDTAQGSEYRGVGIDNVRVTATPGVMAAVPEPATWAMMIAGFGVVGVAMRRSRRMRTVSA